MEFLHSVVVDWNFASFLSFEHPVLTMFFFQGATSTQYGFVFGVFELVVFLSSPLFGHLLPRLGITRAFTAGLLTTGSMCIVFGFLNYIQVATESLYSLLIQNRQGLTGFTVPVKGRNFLP